MTAQDWGLTAADRNECQRDVLAILACHLAGDSEGLLTVWRACNPTAIVPATLGLLTDHLYELGIDAAEWVARRRAELVAELAAGLAEETGGPAG
jgi:hypothetical protein